LHKELPQILAVGGELKNTICLTRGSEAFLSQHIGDLENSAAFDFFREAIEHLSAILEVKPAVIAHDLHPDYLSTKWAVAQKGVRRIGVQHHHAHVAACMAENHLDGRVIGFSFDGTGYGTDGNIWGGEVLIADYERFVRAAHLAYVPLPGGAAAIREPWRMAVSYLLDAIGEGALRVEIPFTRAIDRRKGQMIAKMIAQRINSPLTSSCGRLFDAIAALIGVRHSASYEGQAAVELEMRARRSNDTRAYPFDLYRKGGLCQIGSRPLIRSIVEDLGRGISVETIGRRFHNGLVETLAVLSQRLREETGLNRVCLSGGTFQNELLLGGLTAKLRDASFKVYAPSQVPSGDGGLSLGQAAVAAFHMPPECE